MREKLLLALFFVLVVGSFAAIISLLQRYLLLVSIAQQLVFP